MASWLSAFLFTQIIEIPIYCLLFRCSVVRAFGASALTHPLIWFGLFHPQVPGGYLEKLVVAELFAWLAEAAYFRHVGRNRALLGSLLANAASVTVGLAARAIFGWP